MRHVLVPVDNSNYLEDTIDKIKSPEWQLNDFHDGQYFTGGEIVDSLHQIRATLVSHVLCTRVVIISKLNSLLECFLTLPPEVDRYIPT